jgi:hypothetical protein
MVHDKPAIKVEIAKAWQCAFEQAEKFRYSQVFNQYFDKMLSEMHSLLKSKETIESNLFYTASDSFSTCIEKCDSANLKSSLFSMLEQMLH